MNHKSLALLLSCLIALASSLAAAPASLRVLTQNNYLPGLPVLVRVEAYAPDGSRDRETWNGVATLSADGGVTLSTNLIAMRNGVGSELVTFSGGTDFNFTATVGGVPVTRSLHSVAGDPVTKIGGVVSGGSSTWSGIINVTNDLTITNHVLTIESNTLVLLNGTGSGTGGADIFVNANASIQSLGTELHPVTITCSNVFFTNRWGQIRHNTSLPSLYRHTFIHRAGRAPGEGHTGQAPAVRPSNSTLTFESSTISDLCEPSSTAPGYGTPGKVMYAVGSTLSFNDCLFQRARMGPEIDGTALLFTNSYIMDTRGPDDADGIYLHGQQVGQVIKLVDSVFASGDDDGIDTLGSTITVERCILRDWASVVEDAKAISAFDGSVDVIRCLIVDSTVGVSAKCAAAPASVRVNINHSTITGNLTNVLAQFKANAPGPIVDYRITNCLIWGADAVQSDFAVTNLTIRYSDISEPWAGTGNLQSDPLFVNAAAKNWRLQIASPAINAGNPASPVDVDASITDMGVFPFLTTANPLVSTGAVWRYLDNGSNQGTNWSQRLFDDTLWASGPAQLGYSSNTAELDEATLVSFGPDPANKYITTYFRRAFTVLNPSEFTNLVARLLVDDAAVVFLNGQEVYRFNLPAGAGAVSNQTLALLAVENTNVFNSISPSLLVAGTNVIAVEVHQQSLGSSDLSFDLELTGQRQAVGNQPPSVSITSPPNGAGFITPATIAISVSATDSDGTVTNVQFYQNGALLWLTNSGPYNYTWNGVGVGTYTLTAVALDDAGDSRTSAPVNVTVSVPSTAITNSLVVFGSLWKYHDKGSNLVTAWRASAYDDSSWSNGLAQLGYGDNDEATRVEDNPTPGFNAADTDKFITTYFRRSFPVTNAAAFTNLSLRLLRDDGGIVYLNGVEVQRSPNLPGTILFNTLATGSAPPDNTIDTTNFPTSGLLVEGTNVIAVEIHQQLQSSSDISFDFELIGVRTADTNARPVVALTAPAGGTIFGTPANYTITATAFDSDGTVTNVAFYANGVKLGDDAGAPYSFDVVTPAAAVYSLYVVGTDNVGLSATSTVVNITVSTNIAPPVVFAKTPVPGSLTNLTSLGVTFSKAVTGVSAGDLLVNGSPATGLSGSGSNYTFTFPQPAYGTVSINWAAGHGITDVFTPSHAFDTNSTGANWSYTLLDSQTPTITTINPVPNSTVAALTSIAITFSEPVTGVNAADLLINASPASGLSGSGAGPYSFTFAQPALGVVNVTWAGGHGIVDTSGNPFSPAPWSYTLDTNSSGVVISEIMYHPSSENVLEEYIELFNKGGSAVSLSGWQLSAGVSFTFSNVSIPAGGYLVVAADVTTFTNKYPGVTNVVGNWTGTLRNQGEDIDLDNAAGQRADSVQYADEGDWAVRQRGQNDPGNGGQPHRGWAWFKPHDGGGSSLELINPNLSNNSGQNWGGSLTTNGTPGSANSIFQNNVAPLILEAGHFPLIPRSTDQTVISARLLDEAAGGFTVNLLYRVDGAGVFTSLAMHDDGLNGDAVANDTLWSARIPAQANNAVMEYYISATDAQSNTRTWPGAAIAALDAAGPTGQVANALFQIDDVAYTPTNSQPLFKLIMTAAENAELASIPSQSSLNGPNAAMNATFIAIDASGIEAHYLASVRNRGHGSRTANPPNYRVSFRSDDPWKGVSSLNLNTVQTYYQHLGSVLSRKGGAISANTIAVQVRVNNLNRANAGGGMYGSYAAVEVIDADWAGNHLPLDGDGNVYKVVRDIDPPNFEYRGTNVNAYTNNYFKESNISENDFSDLINMLSIMGENSGALFTPENVRSVINPEQWLRHLAVMNLFANGESGLNTGNNDDYYMYRGLLDPRFILTAHDLDEILGVGLASNTDIFRATCCPISGDSEGTWRAMDRFMRSPDFQPIYYRTLQDLLNTTFSAAQFNATADQTLGGYVPQSVIDSIKTWMDARRLSVQSQIPALYDLTVPVALVTQVPRSPTPFRSASLTVGGYNVVSYQFSLNGGGFSAETLVGAPIVLSALPDGTNTVAVIGRGTNGLWQAVSNATVVSWVVNTNIPAVRLNEVLAQNNAALNHFGTFPDAIELLNEGASTVDIGGLRLTDDPDVPGKFTFPPGTLLAPGSNFVVFANNVDGTPGFHLGFGLDAAGDSVNLFHSLAGGGALLDRISFGRQLADRSIARLDGSGDWALSQPTLGAANVAQPLGSPAGLRINEWLAASLSQEEFVEIYNPAVLPVALGGLSFTDSLIGWPARNVIKPLSFMGAGEYLAFIAEGNGNGGDHLNFGLALEQGEIGLFNTDLSVIDCVIYGPQQLEIAQGKCPNGGLTAITLGTPTPGAPNSCPVALPPPVTVTLLTISNLWSYQPRTNYDAVNWTTNTYNDATWPTGLALLGRTSFASNQIWPEPFRTHIETNSTQTNFYFRAHFNVAPGASYTSLQFRHIIDDGAVFYLNGVEIPGSRFNLPAGPINGAMFASSTISIGAYQGPISIPISMLVTGDNVFAVDVHQSFTNSSDFAMGIELQALIVTNSPALAGVLINEVLANNATFEEPDGSKPDWVELYNPSTNAVDLGDMSLTDDTTVSRRWVIAGGTILNAQSFLKFRFDSGLPASATNAGFALKANGGGVFLFNRLADGGALLSSVAYGLQAADFSIGRLPNGSTNWALNIPTLGSGNLVASLGDPLLLRVNEWMANPLPGNDDYIEVFNPNPQPVDISRFYLTDNLGNRIKHQLPALSFLGVGQDAFQEFKADGNTTLGADHLNFSLAGGGEAAGLTHSNLTALDSISFGPQSSGVSQGRLPDGAATTVNFTTTPTPGKANFLPLNVIVINELIAHTDAPLEDAVELYNPTGDPVDISGWYLSDSQNNLQKYRVPTNTIVPAGGYAVLYEYQFNPDPGPLSFSFSSAKGDEVYLSQSFSPGTVTGYRAFATFGASENGVSFGRFATSLGQDFTALSARTFGVDNPVTTNQFRTGTGLTNAYPKVGPVVLHEIMYRPLLTNELYEFVELRNLTAAAVPLFDTNNPANTWRLRKGVDFNFLPGTTIPAGGYLVVVGFDPVTDPVSLTAFRAQYGTNMTLVGPYSGKLDNNGEELQLQKPDAPQTTPGPDFGLVPYIVADRVVYGDTAPWPTTPDGTGDSLKKLAGNLYGNEALNWLGGTPTPGAANFAAGSNSPPVLAAIAHRSVHVGYPVSLTASATDPDLPGQSLTYSLQGLVPAGAGIGSGSGLFNWTPTTNQGPATHPITVRVTDNGAPALFDEKTFNVAVLSLPRVSSVELTNNSVRLTWESYAGRRYRVEATTNLVNAVWSQVGSDVIAAGLSSSLLNTPASAQIFYRVLSYDN